MFFEPRLFFSPNLLRKQKTLIFHFYLYCSLLLKLIQFSFLKYNQSWQFSNPNIICSSGALSVSLFKIQSVYNNHEFWNPKICWNGIFDEKFLNQETGFPLLAICKPSLSSHNKRASSGSCGWAIRNAPCRGLLWFNDRCFKSSSISMYSELTQRFRIQRVPVCFHF